MRELGLADTQVSQEDEMRDATPSRAGPSSRLSVRSISDSFNNSESGQSRSSRSSKKRRAREVSIDPGFYDQENQYRETKLRRQALLDGEQRQRQACYDLERSQQIKDQREQSKVARGKDLFGDGQDHPG